MKTINILGDIIGGEGERWFFSEVSPKNVIDALKDANGEAVEIVINSNGGSVTGGLAIANAIKTYSGETTCVVLGIAASMASVIACAGKTLKMGEGAFLMVHNPWTYTSGNADDLRKDADTLDKMAESIRSFYKGKCPDKTEDELKELMDAESWLTRDDAKEFGFAVEDYKGELKAAASLTRRGYDKAPDAVKALLKVCDKKPEPEAAEKPVEPSKEAPKGETAETPAPAPETAEKPSEPPTETPTETAEEKPVADKDNGNWEARFKGLSKKFNEQAEAHKAQIDGLTAEIESLKGQCKQSGQDLADAKAEVSNLTAKLEESTKALQTAQAELADTRDSLQKAEDKAKELIDTRDMLTAGVLTPPTQATYAEKMKAARTPQEREELRALKKAGKIN